MLKTVRNIRKLYNAKLLFVSSDETITQVIGNEFDDYFKELKVAKTMEDALSLACSNSYDMAIIDADIEGVSFSEDIVAPTAFSVKAPKAISLSGVEISFSLGVYTL